MAVQVLVSDTPISRLRLDYEQYRQLFDAQPAPVQNFLLQQAGRIADAIAEHAGQVRFRLPDRVVPAADETALEIPVSKRDQAAGGWFRAGQDGTTRSAVLRRLHGLEHDPVPSVAAGGMVMRFALAHTMIHDRLPDGHTVTYTLDEDDDIPSLPTGALEESALTASGDAIAEEPARDGRVQVPFAPHARRFFLPQWVAFGEQDELLTNSVAEAEGRIASMQAYLETLHNAAAVAPFIVTDGTYQRKRAGMLGQLVNQGRALGRYRTREAIETIRRRASAGDLNRGVSLSLPYFDDQLLKMRLYGMEVVPAGRIQFVGAFIVRAVRLESAKIVQDTRLSQATRLHLLKQLEMLEKAFRNSSSKK